MIVSAQNRSGANVTNAELAELVEELSARLESGEVVDIDEFTAAHPEFAAELRNLYPALQQLANFSRSGSANLPSGDVDADPLAGVLGDFRLIREVGRGGMGVVYEAEQISLRRRVALKVLPWAAAMDPKQLQRFKNEALAAASLKHDHIVSVYAVGCERGVHYYAMEFIEGQTLAQLIGASRERERPEDVTADYTPVADAPVSPAADTAPVAALTTERSGLRGRKFQRRAAELIADAADALEHAHSLGIVHRDIKPANLLLNADGRLYVSDFGLARFGPDAGLTMSGDLLGTLRYMAPEQTLARHGLADHRVDVYGLGCTLYELLTGRPAVGGQDKADIVRRIAFEEPVGLRKLDKTIPAELETITLKCLAKNPAERYPTAKELADDLRRWLSDHAIKAKPPGVRARVAKWGRRHRAFVHASVAILVFAVIGLGLSTWLVWHEKEFTRHAKDAAEAREAETIAVLDFVENRVFAAARPENREGGLGHDVSLRRAVEAALPFVERSFTGQPLIEARLRRTIGKSFLFLGDYAIAAEQFSTARSQYTTRLGYDHPATLETMTDLANCFEG